MSDLFNRVADELITDEQYKPLPKKSDRKKEKEAMIALERRAVLRENEKRRGVQ